LNHMTPPTRTRDKTSVFSTRIKNGEKKFYFFLSNKKLLIITIYTFKMLIHYFFHFVPQDPRLKCWLVHYFYCHCVCCGRKKTRERSLRRRMLMRPSDRPSTATEWWQLRLSAGRTDGIVQSETEFRRGIGFGKKRDPPTLSNETL
jgi:hypothetical protein